MALPSVLKPAEKSCPGDNRTTTKQRHHHKQEARVHLNKEYVRLDSEKYEWENWDDSYSDTKWYRVSKNYVLMDGTRVHFVAEKDRGQYENQYSPDATRWDDVRHRVKDRKLIRKLNKLLDPAMEKKERHDQAAAERREKKKEKRLQKAVLAIDNLEDSSSSDSSSSSAKEKPKQASAGRVTRTKRGVRLSSNDHKYYFNIAVFKSTKYPGCASVQLVVKGQWYNYTLDAANMKALREEVARGGN
jgi:hypothetical protein